LSNPDPRWLPGWSAASSARLIDPEGKVRQAPGCHILDDVQKVPSAEFDLTLAGKQVLDDAFAFSGE
jgi:hypothetical protein